MRERTKGVWELRVSLGADPVTGTRRTRSKTFRGSKTAANRELTRLQAAADLEREAELEVDHDDPTLRELVEQWTAQNIRTWSPKTAADYAHAIPRELFDRGQLGDVRVSRLTTKVIDQAYVRMVDAGTTASTLEKVHRILKAILNQAVRWDLLAKNPAHDAKLPVRHVPRKRSTTVGAVRAVLEDLEDDPDTLMAVGLAIVTGVRIATLLGLQWRDVDLEARTIEWRRRVLVIDSDRYVLDGSKTGSASEMIIGESTADRLADYRRRAQATALAAGVGRLPARAFVFSSSADGSQHWNPAMLSTRWRKLADRHGMDGIRFHDLRHTMVSRLLGDGYDLAAVAERADHSSPNVTLAHYSHALPTKGSDIADHLDQLIYGDPA